MIPPRIMKFISTGMGLGLLMLVTSYYLVYWNKVYPGVRVIGEVLGGKTEVEAEMLLIDRAYSVNQERPAVTLDLEGNEWHVLKAEVDFVFLPQISAHQAVKVGREGPVGKTLGQQWQAMINGIELPMQFSYDTELMQMRIASIAAEIDLPAVPPSLEVIESKKGAVVVAQKGEEGLKVNEEELIREINTRLAYAKTLKIKIPAEKVGTDVNQKQIEETRLRAEVVVDKRVVLKADEQQWTLKGEELINFLRFEGGFDEGKAREYVAGLAKAIDRPAQNAAFAYMGGRVAEFREAKDGLVVDQEKTIKQFIKLLEALEQGEEESLALVLPVVRSNPTITLTEVNNLGIKELLGKGVSTYRGSIAGRVHNVGLSAQRVNGVLVKPGEEFSFNASVGEISGATGYQPAYVIRSGATVLDDGGGTCQTSTTVFRAALNAGLPITQRRAHSYRVGYYEQNAKAGLDATVYSPSVDLKFKNDTPAHILVQTKANVGSRTLTVEIFGTSDGRKATIANHRVWDIVPAPPPRYQDDPTLPAGTTKQVDYAADGAKAKFDYTVTRGGETIYNKTFYSNFRPWQAVYLKGV